MRKLNKSVIEKTERPIKVMQIGEGNFLRAFVDWIIQEGNDKGLINTDVAVVQPIEFGRVKELAEQDGLYTVILEGLENGVPVSKKSVIDVLSDFINPYPEYDKFLSYAKSEDLRFFISNTTEAGIVLDKNDTDFSKTPASFPGKLLALLLERYKHFNGDKNKGLIIIPCELIDKNGKELKSILNELANLAGLDQGFINWMNEANTFCSTLVDRIVPGYPRDEVTQLQDELGYEDHSMVKGEVFHLWVIETDNPSVKEEFPLDEAGLNVVFVDDLTPYKQRKVGILNGSHTGMVPVAYLYGLDTVKESVEHEVVGRFIKHMMFDEIKPTIDLSQEELNQFASDVIERFRNPYVRHELKDIALNSTTKFKTRNLPAVTTYIERTGELPRCLLFSLASTLVYYRGVRNGQPIPVNDNPEFLELYKELWESYDGTRASVEAMVERFLGLKEHWEVDFTQYEGVHAFVTDSVYAIVQDGMEKAIHTVLPANK